MSENFESQLLEAYKKSSEIGDVYEKMKPTCENIHKTIIKIVAEIMAKFNLKRQDEQFAISDETWEFKNELNEKYLSDPEVKKLYDEYLSLVKTKRQFDYPNESVCIMHRLVYLFQIKEIISDMQKQFGETKADFINLKIKRELYKYENERGIDTYFSTRPEDENIITFKTEKGKKESYYKRWGSDYNGAYYIILQPLDSDFTNVDSGHLFKVERDKKGKEFFTKELDVETNIEVFALFRKSRS